MGDVPRWQKEVEQAERSRCRSAERRTHSKPARGAAEPTRAASMERRGRGVEQWVESSADSDPPWKYFIADQMTHLAEKVEKRVLKSLTRERDRDRIRAI